MLRINSIKNADKAVAYYDSSLAVGDYYAGRQEATIGKWHGKLASKLGIEGNVQREHFEKISKNQHPLTGRKLKPRNKSNARMGYDCTFNPQKGISLTHAITGDQDILKSHEAAVAYVMTQIEAAIQTQAGQGKNKHYERTGNCLWGSFTHFTTRPIKQERDNQEVFIPDPHLHTHAVVQNLTFHDKNNRFQAIEMSTIKREGLYYEALYHSKLAELLQKAGYTVKQKGRFIDIDLPQSAIDKFSNRTREIEALAEKRNITNVKTKSKLGVYSRRSKEELDTKLDYRSDWKSRLTPEELQAILSAKSDRSTQKETGKDIHRELELALDHHMERKAVVPENLVKARVLSRGLGEFTPEELDKAFEQRKDIISAERGNTKVITTKEMIRLEEQNLEFAVKGRNTQKPLNRDFEIGVSMLNEDQRKAVDHVLKSRDRVILVSGDAGVGKTTLMKSVKHGIEAGGRILFAVAPSADASRGALADKGFENATTIADFLQNEKLQKEAENFVLLVDEAGMIGTKDMHRIFSLATEKNLRVILSGDYKQIPSVQAGQTQKMLEQSGQLPVARVKEIVRQRNNPELKSAIKALADRDHEKAYRLLDKQKSIIEIQDQSERDQAIARDFVKTQQSGRSVMLVSPTHREGERITEQIREELKAKGLIEKDERVFQTQKSLSWTEAEKQEAAGYKKGQIVQFHKRTENYRHGYKYDVLGHNDKGEVIIDQGQKGQGILDLTVHQNFQVFEKKETKIAAGDLVRITGNGKSQEGKALHNGQVFKVTGFDEAGHIKLEQNKTLRQDYGQFTNGFYRTAHSAQGKDSEVLILSQTTNSAAITTENSYYVSVSRGAEQARVYTDDKEELRKSVARPDEQLNAMDLARETEEKRLKQKAHEAVYDRLREQTQKLRTNEPNITHRTTSSKMVGREPIPE